MPIKYECDRCGATTADKIQLSKYPIIGLNITYYLCKFCEGDFNGWIVEKKEQKPKEHINEITHETCNEWIEPFLSHHCIQIYSSPEYVTIINPFSESTIIRLIRDNPNTVFKIDGHGLYKYKPMSESI